MQNIVLVIIEDDSESN